MVSGLGSRNHNKLRFPVLTSNSKIWRKFRWIIQRAQITSTESLRLIGVRFEPPGFNAVVAKFRPFSCPSFGPQNPRAGVHARFHPSISCPRLLIRSWPPANNQISTLLLRRISLAGIRRIIKQRPASPSQTQKHPLIPDALSCTFLIFQYFVLTLRLFMLPMTALD
jgi:hypothetical protein